MILNLKAKRNENTNRPSGIEPSSYSKAAKEIEEDLNNAKPNYEKTKVKIV